MTQTLSQRVTRPAPSAPMAAPDTQGQRVFFSVCLADSQATVLVDHADALRWAVGRTLGDMPVSVLSWVTLPAAIHTIWEMPAGDLAYGRRWGAIKRRFSQAMPVGHASPAGLWQNRFCAQVIHDEADLRLHTAFCHHAPVRAGLVTRAEDWPLASFSNQYGLRQTQTRHVA